MKVRVNVVLTIAVALVFGSAFIGCGIETDYAAPQHSKIESYLKSQGLTASLTTDSVYVVLGGNSLAAPSETRAATGDSVVFNFAAYTFGTAPSAQPYYTNKYWLAVTLSENLDVRYWNFNPIRAKLGEGKIIKGVESALLSCRAGDSLAAFITSNLAYGNLAMGTVPANTALMMVLTVEDVIKE